VLNIDELGTRWDIFKLHRNDFSIFELILLFSQDDLSSDWSELEKKKLLDQLKIWYFPAPQNLKQSQLLEQILECLLNNYNKNEYIDTLSQKYFWVEQWCTYGIDNNIISSYQYELIAEILQKRNFLANSENILFEMMDKKVTTTLLQIVVSCCVAHQQYGKAIYFQKSVIQRTQRLTDEKYKAAWLEFIHYLLLRNGQYSTSVKDVELAYSLIDQYVDGNNPKLQDLNQLLQQNLTANCFGQPLTVSGFEKIILSINRFNFNTAHKWFGGNAELPYHRDLVKSAPVVLSQDELKKYFQKHNHLSETFHQIFNKKKSVDEYLFQASTISALMFWNYSQIEPTVLDALSFASAGKPTNFFDLQEKGSGLSEDAIIRLSGYVAEQQVALNLQQQGHHVQFPDKSNQEGFDLLVDGYPMQVKCTMSESYVREHLNQHPDIPVIVNRELAGAFENNPNVIIDYQLSHSLVQESTATSIQHLEQFGSTTELLLAPLVTVLFSAQRHYSLIEQGAYTAQDFILHTAVDSSVRLGGVFAGKSIGFAIGSFAGPVGAIVGATAGVYLGNVFATSQSDQFLKSHVTQQGKKVALLLKDFAEWFVQTILVIRHQKFSEDLKKHPMQIINYQEHIEDEQILLLHFRFLHEQKLRRLEEFEQYLKYLLEKSFAHAVQAGWICLENADQFYHPKLKVWLHKLNTELTLYQEYVLQPNINNSTSTTITKLQ